MNTNMESEAMSNAAMIGGIISGASLLESRMHQLTGSDEPGLHKLTELLADKLSESVKRQLHYIGAVRNQAAHEADFVITEEEYARFNSALENVKAALDAIGGFTPYLGYSSGDAAENATGAAVTAETPAEDRTDDPVDLAVERELFKEIAGKIAVMGFYPFVGIVQLLWIFAGALLRQGWVVLLTLLYASAVILGIKG